MRINVVSDVCEELQKAMKVNQLFSSPHHGYAIILEELDELWDEVKKREPDMKNMRAEAVQVAAMAVKFIFSMENNWNPSPRREWNGEKILQNEVKCRQCKYTSLTAEQLAEIKGDPCNTCHDLSNWKPKEAEAQ
ncbi:hypothetical protein [Desulfosporosinus hippei]|uniref:Uncharacterized protein n=1 Tax=Desulfosporosinus hippei DSM 8344 TaxID=1121419 RepID=A0A1G7UL76_9FIRM|nr:hypothetical protein [Desulfosporosinus hippei]SDG47981.1 hypothetical protein SAMN05443529_103171 [Desulfosporosinus hippei DSM 8344]